MLEEKIVVRIGLQPATFWLQALRVPDWARRADMSSEI